VPLKLFFILIILLLTGCASSPIDLSEIKLLPQDEGIVFGCVKVIEGGKEKKLSLLGESKFRLIILPDNSSKAIYVPLKDDGTFIWHLPAGSYTIASFEWHSYGILGGRVFASFRVLKNKATYIGTLTLSFTGTRYTMFVVDEYEASSITFKDKFPDMKEEAIRYLMQMEERR
jgi:hypothetical protein